MRVRHHIALALPIDHSLIPLDILLTTVAGDREGNDLTVKALFASLPYSDMGIRYHFNKLLISGWIELHNGDKDLRVKRIKVTTKLDDAIEQLAEQLEPQLNVYLLSKLYP